MKKGIDMSWCTEKQEREIKIMSRPGSLQAGGGKIVIRYKTLDQDK